MTRLATAVLLFATAALTLSLGSIRVTTLSGMPLAAVPAPVRIAKPVAPPVQGTPPGYVVNRAPVSYPTEAIQKRIEGSVVVELTFNARGEIVDSRVLSGPQELRQAALQTALQGKYGIDLARTLQVIVDFKLPAAGTAELAGTVTDSLRVPLPGVIVAATNTETGIAAIAISNETGGYRFQDLRAGSYRLSARLDGFQNQSFDNVRMGNSQQVRFNFALQPGAGTVAASSVGTQLNQGVLEGIDIRGLQEPFLTEMRQKLQVLQGQPITSDLLNQVRASIKESSWGEKPVGFIVSSRTANSSDLLVAFYDSPNPPNRVRVGGNVMASNLIQQVKPAYSPQAKDAKIQGVVVLEINVRMDGTVASANVITGHPLLIQSAIDAVRQWVYKPVLLNGQPIEAVSTVTVNFTFQE